MTDATPRWRYRFENYSKAFALLKEAMELFDRRALSELEQEGLVQRFEYTWELGWNLLADLLAEDGVALETKTPRTVIRAAYMARLIEDGETWMDALAARNKMSHNYSKAQFEKIVESIRLRFFGLLQKLHDVATARAASAP